nr:MAG TPA: hypothetical protein [Bacteriophage sp.]
MLEMYILKYRLAKVVHNQLYHHVHKLLFQQYYQFLHNQVHLMK